VYSDIAKKKRFARLSRLLPFMPVFGGGKSRFQPVYVGDIARCVEIVSRNDREVQRLVSGKIIEAGGPDSEHQLR
jgi:NADH dehydrogenase